MKNKKTINRVLQLIRPYTYLVVSILVLAAVTVAATLYSPILIGKGVDCMIEKGLVSFPDLKLVLLQLAVVTAISAISQWVMSLLTNKMTYKIVDDTADRVFAHMEILPLRYMDAHQPGDAISRISTDVDQFSDGLLMGFTQLFSGRDDDSRNTGIYDIHRWKNHADRGIDHAVIFFRGKFYRKTYIYHVPSAV